MPMSTSYQKRLSRILPQLVDTFGTPFHIYDEKGIKETCSTFTTAFENIDGFKEFFAVKALPNPSIMKIMQKMGFGFDCSSTPEIQLSSFSKYLKTAMGGFPNYTWKVADISQARMVLWSHLSLIIKTYIENMWAWMPPCRH